MRTRLDTFCLQHHAPLVGFATRFGASYADANDAVQEMWLKLHRLAKLESLVGEEHAWPFLLTSLKRIMGNTHRKRQTEKRGRGVQVVSLEDLEFVEPSHSLTPDRLADVHQLQREAERIGAMSGTKTTRVELFRQRKKWRKQLAAYLEPGFKTTGLHRS